MSLARRAERTLLSLDLRSLGLFRILFSLLLLYDLARRVGSIRIWYAEGGPVAHGSLPLSFFHFLPSATATAIGFTLCALVYLGLLLGWRTKLMQVLAVVAVLSLHNRCIIVERSGEKVLDLFTLWTAFLPLGARFSLDARRLRPPKEVRSIAVLAILIQLSGIYLLAGIQKNGPTWHEGTAIHYFLQRCDVVTSFGLAIRDHFPEWLGKFMSWATLAIEDLLPLLLFTPFRTVTARRIAIVLMVALNAGIALLVDLGIYQPTMVILCVLFLSDEDWAILRRLRPLRFIVDRLRSLFPPREKISDRWSPIPALVYAREALCGLFLVAAIACALNQNEGVTFARHTPIPGLERAMADLGLPEAWARFAPDVPQGFRMLAVDAVLSDGRHLDPLAFAARGDAGPPRTEVPDRLDFDTFWHNYERILGTPLFRANQPALESWIRSHGERTGRPAEHVVSFTLYGLVRSSPPPGTTKASTQRFPIAIAR
jgi:hypothetical protein